MKLRLTPFGRVTVTVCSLLLLAGCTAATQHQWLTFFFEGVDRPAPIVTPSTPTTVTTNLLPAALTAAQPRQFVHEPYFNRKCAECHVTTFSQQLRASGDELCAICHKPYLQKINAAKFVHRPVEKGQCLRCHEPHQSPERFLLSRPGDALCLKCHDKEDMAEVKAHANIQSTACLACHDPHGSEQKWLPRKP